MHQDQPAPKPTPESLPDHTIFEALEEARAQYLEYIELTQLTPEETDFNQHITLKRDINFPLNLSLK